MSTVENPGFRWKKLSFELISTSDEGTLSWSFCETDPRLNPFVQRTQFRSCKWNFYRLHRAQKQSTCVKLIIGASDNNDHAQQQVILFRLALRRRQRLGKHAMSSLWGISELQRWLPEFRASKFLVVETLIGFVCYLLKLI